MSERSGSSFRRVVAVVASLLLAGVLTACDPPTVAKLTSAKIASKSAPLTAAERSVVDAVNHYRAAHHLRALKVKANLSDKARLWAAAMAGGRCGRAANGTPKICHSNLKSGITVQWTLLAENVGAASPKTNISGIMRGFEKSRSHQENILNTKISAIGAGVAYSGNNVYVAEEFMAQ
jgi:uncharacterized protein YkwD